MVRLLLPALAGADAHTWLHRGNAGTQPPTRRSRGRLHGQQALIAAAHIAERPAQLTTATAVTAHRTGGKQDRSQRLSLVRWYGLTVNLDSKGGRPFDASLHTQALHALTSCMNILM